MHIFVYNIHTMQDEINEKLNTENNEEEITFEPETDSDQAAPQKDLADKVKKLKAELEAVKKEKQEYLDGWQRLKADTINAKKRDDEDKKQFMRYANIGLVEELLQVIQSFDMAMGNKEAWEKVEPNWRAGVEYINKQLRDILDVHGLVEINPLGLVFNPAEHEAVEHVVVDFPQWFECLLRFEGSVALLASKYGIGSMVVDDLATVR